MLRYWPVLLWLIYFISPIDLIHDFIPVVGRVDDLLLLILLFFSYMRKGRKRSAGGADPFFGRKENAGAGTYGSYGRYGGHEGRYEYSKGGPYEGGAERREHSRARDNRQSTRKDPYRILGVERSASMEQIKRAYRLQASRYHPDKVAHLGEEFQALAKERFQDIQWAYEQLNHGNSS